MVTNISRNPEETEALGRAWGRDLPVGTVVGLHGDLGAGKTCLVRGLAAGAGCRGRVHSPTFTLVNEYSGGRCPVYHLDLYRLEDESAIVEAGLESFLAPEDGLAVIEWFERWTGSRPQKYRQVYLRVLGDSEREIRYEDIGF